MLKRLTLLVAIALTPAIIPGSAISEGGDANHAFFETFMTVCTRNINDISVVHKMAKDFELPELPPKYRPPGKDFMGWFLPIGQARYILSVDIQDNYNICACESENISVDYIRSTLGKLFLPDGTFKLIKKLPADDNYIWQEIYNGTDPKFEINLLFVLKKRPDTLTLTVMAPKNK